MIDAKNFDAAAVRASLLRGLAAANAAGSATLRQIGNRDCCGFAWTTVTNVRSNSKLGKILAEFGFSKAYGCSGLQLWDPAKLNTQCITPKEDGARAMARVLKDELGLEAYSGSRMD